MKKTFLLSVFAMIIGLGMAQDAPVAVKKKPKLVLGGDGIYLRDSTWRLGGYLGFSVSQTALYQWGPGGNNNFALLVGANFFANYKKGKLIWDNSFDAKFGMVANGLIRSSALAKSNLQKNIDVFDIKSSVGYQLKNNLYASANVGFESQFAPSYDYSQTDTVGGNFRRFTVSKFAAPAIVTIGPGLTWKPKKYFTLFFSPVEGKMTFVSKDDPGRDMDTTLGGAYTNRYYTDVDETRFGLEKGTSFMGQLGWELDLLFQKDIVKNVNWKSHLNVFGAYLSNNYNTQMPEYFTAQDSLGTTTIKSSTKYIPVVKWENDIIFKVNSWLSATLSTKFVYQYNALVPIDTHKNSTGAKGRPDGITDVDKAGNIITGFNKLQIFEQFGIGLSFKF